MAVRLRHVTFAADSRIYFYDGELPVEAGVVTIPSGRPEWAAAAWVRGYRFDADTGEQLAPHQIQERVLQPEPETVEPVEEPAPAKKPTTRRRTTTAKRTRRKVSPKTA
jgi:hypothetical protein